MKLCSKQRYIRPTSVMHIALYKVIENSLNSLYSTTLPRMSSNVQVSYLYCTTFTLLCTVSKTTDKCGARLDATISLNGSELSAIFSQLQLQFLTLQKAVVKAATCKETDTNKIYMDSNVFNVRSKESQLSVLV